MKVTPSDSKDRFGVFPCATVSGADATPQNIFNWLWEHGYQGYKFAVIYDLSHDEYEEPDKQTPIYFLDTLIGEICETYGVQEVEKWLEKRRSM